MPQSLSKIYIHAIFSTEPGHHKKVDCKDELRLFLKKYNVDFDEKYVWD